MFSRTMTRSTGACEKKVRTPAVDLAGADAGVEVERLAEVDVDAAEAGADGRGDRGLEGHLGAAARFDHAVGDRGAELGHDVDAGLLLVPVDRDAGGLDAHLGGLGQLRPDAVAADERHFVRHRCCISRGCSARRGPRRDADVGCESGGAIVADDRAVLVF